MKPWMCGLIAFIFQPAFAYYCSTQTHNGFINPGDTMTQVLSACGQPQEKSEPESVIETETVTIQYWVYDNAYQKTNNFVAANPPLYDVDRNAAMLVLKIVDGKVTYITQGDPGKSSGYCAARGSHVRMGETMDSVMQRCGTPNKTTIQQESQPSGASQEQEIWTYQFDTYTQPIRLKFLNGQLADIDG